MQKRAALSICLLVAAVCIGLLAAKPKITIGAENFNQPKQYASGQPLVHATQAGGAVITFDSVHDPAGRMGMIAHEMGTIDGETYTSTLDAFKLSYAKGFRLFEMDLVTLKDGTILAAHDGSEAHFGLKQSFSETTFPEIAGVKFDGKYTPLYGDQLITLLKDYPDVYFLLDTKVDHVKIVRMLAEYANYDPQLMDRLIPHVTDQQNYDQIMAIYPFKTTMLALYRLLAMRAYSEDEIIAYIQKNHISAVMMSINADDPGLAKINNGNKPNTFSFQKFHEKLDAARIPHYVHSASTLAEVQYFRNMGVGAYSDGIYPQPE